MKRRFGGVETNLTYAVATILDPRFKKLHFTNKLACAEAVKQINLEMNQELHKRKQARHTISENVTR